MSSQRWHAGVGSYDDRRKNQGTGSPTSMCHAWSAGPTADLSRYVLGVQPVKPGFKAWQVVPQAIGLDCVRGKHSVPGGEIKVEWSFDNNGLLHMAVDAPKNTNGTVYLPVLLIRALKNYHASAFVFCLGPSEFVYCSRWQSLHLPPEGLVHFDDNAILFL
jgi:hypothetical protein